MIVLQRQINEEVCDFLYNSITQSLNFSVKVSIKVYYDFICVFPFVSSYVEYVFVLDSHFCTHSKCG